MRAGLRLIAPCLLLIALWGLPVAPVLAGSETRPVGKVYLMRGLANIFSYGLDNLAETLRARHVEAQVFGFEQWEQLADDAVSWSMAHGRAPVVIVGHSLGADSAVNMAERMTALGRPPSLVVTFDPVGVTTVGAARGRFLNFYQANNGFGKRLSTNANFHGKLINRDLTGAAGIDHFNMEKDPGLHAQVVNQILAVMTPPRPKLPPQQISPDKPTNPPDIYKPDIVSGPHPARPIATPGPSTE